MKKLDIKKLRHAAVVLKVIAHPDRLRIVEALEHRSRTVTQLTRELGLEQVSVSKHLALLKKRGIVQSRVASNFRHYSVSYPNVIHVLDCLRKNQ